MKLDTTSQQVTTPAQSNTPEPLVNSPISNQKGFVPIIIGVILSIFVAGGAYYLGTQQQSSSSNQTQNTSNNPAIEQTTANSKVTSTPEQGDETSNWKLYSNTAFKYSLKYPTVWEIGVKGGADPNTFLSPYFSSPCVYDRGDLCTQMNVQATDMNALKQTDPYYYKTIQPFDPSFIINLTGSNPDRVTNKISMKVGGEEAVGFDYFQSNYGNSGRLLYVVVVNNNGMKYTITYEESQKNRMIKSSSDWQDKSQFDEILSTLTFTD